MSPLEFKEWSLMKCKICFNKRLILPAKMSKVIEFQRLFVVQLQEFINTIQM